jgi:regulator of protease activity HflC (stomatin/prohibitin superfamily)
MFQWLGDLLQTLALVCPRLLILPHTHAGVKFVHGAKVKPIAPGVHWYWPVVTMVKTYPTVRQTLNLVAQTTLTRDLRPVFVSAVVTYRVADIRAALADTWDVEETMGDIAMTAVVECIGRHDYPGLAAGIAGSIELELTRAVRRRLRRYGIQVFRCALTDFAQARVFRVVGEQPATHTA